jgi:hypothetical protein
VEAAVRSGRVAALREFGEGLDRARAALASDKLEGMAQGVRAAWELARALDPTDEHGHGAVFAETLGLIADIGEGRRPRHAGPERANRPPDSILDWALRAYASFIVTRINQTGTRLETALDEVAAKLGRHGIPVSGGEQVRSWRRQVMEGAAPAVVCAHYRTMVAGEEPPILSDCSPEEAREFYLGMLAHVLDRQEAK